MINAIASPFPEISVLMPAYNSEAYVREAIDSILAQTYGSFEFLIIDDCSSDTTWDIIQAKARTDSRISTHRNPQNLGISKSRNRLISLARGKYLVWQDSDDISLPNRLESQYQFMEKHPAVGIAGGSLNFLQGTKIRSQRSYSADDATLRSLVFRQSPVAQPAAIIRKDVLTKAGLFDDTLPQAEDLDLSLRIGKYSQFSNLQEVVLLYRFHSESVTTQKLRENIRSTLLVRDRAAHLYGYARGYSDWLVHIITMAFLYLPPRFTYFVFNAIRNKRSV